VRLGWQFNDAILADAFVQRFQPTVYGNPNTQYNVIPVGFTVHDLFYRVATTRNSITACASRATTGSGASRRWRRGATNPDGVFRWTASGVDRNLPCSSVLDATVACRVELTLQSEGLRSGALLAQSAFEVAPGGVYSADEWFNYAARVRLPRSTA